MSRKEEPFSVLSWWLQSATRGLSRATQRRIISEITDHYLDSIEEKRREDMTSENVEYSVIEDLGDPGELNRSLKRVNGLSGILSSVKGFITEFTWNQRKPAALLWMSGVLLLAGTVYYAAAPREYRAHAMIQIKYSSPAVGAQSDTLIDIFSQVVSGKRRLVECVVRDLNLKEDYRNWGRGNLFEMVEKDIAIRAIPLTRLVEVSADHPTPETAADIANAFAAQVVEGVSSQGGVLIPVEMIGNASIPLKPVKPSIAFVIVPAVFLLICLAVYFMLHWIGVWKPARRIQKSPV